MKPRKELEFIQIMSSSSYTMYGLDKEGKIWLYIDKDIGWVSMPMYTIDY